MNRLPTRGDNTIWGIVQQAEFIAPGIVKVHTAGHGGYVLDQARAASVYKMFPEFTTFGGDSRSFEEDCDWCVVALAFPQSFGSATIKAAEETMKGMASLSEKWAKCWASYSERTLGIPSGWTTVET